MGGSERREGPAPWPLLVPSTCDSCVGARRRPRPPGRLGRPGEANGGGGGRGRARACQRVPGFIYDVRPMSLSAGLLGAGCAAPDRQAGRPPGPAATPGPLAPAPAHPGDRPQRRLARCHPSPLSFSFLLSLPFFFSFVLSFLLPPLSSAVDGTQDLTRCLSSLLSLSLCPGASVPSWTSWAASSRIPAPALGCHAPQLCRLRLSLSSAACCLCPFGPGLPPPPSLPFTPGSGHGIRVPGGAPSFPPRLPGAQLG